MIKSFINKYRKIKEYKLIPEKKKFFKFLFLLFLITSMVFLVKLIHDKSFIENHEIKIKKIHKKQRNLYLLDSGHGFKGTCKGNHVVSGDSCFHEYAYVYEVREILAEMLDSTNIMYKYVDNKSLERDLGINKRVKIVNKYKALIKEKYGTLHNVLLISIHANHSSKNSKATGIEVFINLKKARKFEDYELFETEMKAIGNLFADNIVKYSGLELRQKTKKRKYKFSHESAAGNIGILKRTNTYAILTENGFFSNPDERELMSSREFKIKIAYAHYVSICYIEGIKPKDIKTWI